jgi:hypothetical protein
MSISGMIKSIFTTSNDSSTSITLDPNTTASNALTIQSGGTLTYTDAGYLRVYTDTTYVNAYEFGFNEGDELVVKNGVIRLKKEVVGEEIRALFQE